MTTQTIQKIFTRDFVLGSLSQFTFSVANYLLIPTLPIYLSSLGSKESEIGVLIGTFAISSLVMRPFVGRALLRIPEKQFMMIGNILFALTAVAYLLVRPFWSFWVVRVFQGFGLACFNTAVFTLIANISPEKHRGQSIGYFWLSFNIALVLAPALGMLLINQLGFTVLFLTSLGASLSSIFVTGKLRGRLVFQQEKSFAETGFFIEKKAIPSSIIIFSFYLIWGGLTAFCPLYARNNGIANPGLFFTAIAIMLIAGRILGGRMLDLYSREKIIVYFQIVIIISVIVLAFSRTLLMFILAGIIFGIGSTFFTPTIMAYTLEQAGSSRGPAMGTYTAFSDLGMSLGPVIMGLIIPFTGYPIMFLCLALVGAISLAYFYFFVIKAPRIIMP